MNPVKKEIEAKRILKKVDEGMAEISPLITKKLIEEFEKTGVSPVFSKDGKITSLKLLQIKEKTSLIGEDHWADLENEIKKFDYSLGDFWFLEYDQTKYGSGIYTLCGGLLVVAKESGKSKEYDVGYGSTFPADLIKDIKQNFFK